MKLLTIDIETTGLNWQSKILSVAVAYREEDVVTSKAWTIAATDLFHPQTPIPQVRSELQTLIAQHDIICGHNLSFDLSFLYKYNLLDPQWIKGKTIDTLILARMTKAFESVSLYNVAAIYGLDDPQWQAMKGDRAKLDRIPVEKLLDYNRTDVEKNLLLLEFMLEEALKIYSLEHILFDGDFASVVAQMRCNGLAVDYEKLDHAIETTRTLARRELHHVLLPQKIEGGNDATQIIKYLHHMEIKPKRFTEKGKVKISEDALIEIVDEIADSYGAAIDTSPLSLVYTLPDDVKLPQTSKEIISVIFGVLNHRTYEKMLNTWLEPTLNHASEDGLVHALYGAGGTVSYRLNCSEPNLQAFKALDIWQPYANADFSQAEYRLMAMYAKSNNLAQAYQAGIDAHTGTAKILFGKDQITKDERKIAKTFNFAALYGAGIRKLMANSGLDEFSVRKMQTQFSKKLPEIGFFTKEVNSRWKDRGYIILWDGTRIWATKFDREERAYKGANQICQGGVSRLTARAMVKLHEQGVKLLGQVHDSIQFPVDVDKELVTHVMETTLDDRLCNLTRPPIKMVADFEIKGISDKK